MNRTKIEYLDYTWNITAGCTGIGCAVYEKCWARAMAKRLARYCDVCPSFKPHVHWNRMFEPLTVKTPSLIGTSFMGDFYDPWISGGVRASIYMLMDKACQHWFLVLTKQPQNIEEMLPKNLSIGVSVNCQNDVWRIEELKQTKAILKAVSFEPLYESVTADLKGIDWVIIGAQTRPLLMPEAGWVQSLMQAANLWQIPVFLKDNLEPEWNTKHHQEYPEPNKWFIPCLNSTIV